MKSPGPVRLILFISACCAVAALALAADKKAMPMDMDKSPIFGVGIPPDYRNWQVIAVAQEAGDLDSLRVILGNPIALKAYREGTLPFPDGAELAKVAWKRVPSAESEGAFVPGDAQTVQFMLKDSRKFASSGGWGFGRFTGGKPADLAQHQTCFACHAAKVKDHDRVFTRLPPW